MRLMEEEREESAVESKTQPWHHVQLYKLYGDEAESFLHPKINHHVRKPVHPKLEKYGGHAGVETLWKTLRGESLNRLQEEDENIPEDLKVPEKGSLTDQSMKRQAQVILQRMDIMYKASQSNYDRANVHLYNNPLPDINDIEGKESITQYLPYSSNSAIEPSFVLNTTPDGSSRLVGEKNTAFLTEANSGNEFIKQKNQAAVIPLNRLSKSKYIFLTESGAKSSGQFSQRYQEEHKTKNLPKPFLAENSKTNSFGKALALDTTNVKHQTAWEPLTMNALMEYKQVLNVSSGHVTSDHLKMWNVPQ